MSFSKITGSDVKTASTTSTATGGVALTSHRSRLRGYVIAGGAADGTVTFRNGSASGDTIFIAPCNANDTETLNIPDSGVLFENGVHATLSNIDRVTVFHS
tara:strand:+ start:2765 stop:3067 length:303 start_codon:yes stop_codon:yes gene_type:complete